jgi:Cu/Ag efflux pump CusA
MATVIMFGLATSTALNMIVVPVVYARFGTPVSHQRSGESRTREIPSDEREA